MSSQAKGLAALLAAHGRNGDTELMHVTKGEIQALNRIKRGMDGRDLPRNPKTGLAEASFFNNVMPYLKAAAPIIAGGAATALTGGAASPLLVGALAGGATGAGLAAADGKSGNDVLMGGGLGALGGVGGAGMASGLGLGAGAAEAGTASTTAGTVTEAAVPNAFVGEGAGLGGANAFSGTPTPLPGGEAAFGSTGAADVTATQASPFQQGLAEGAKAYNAPTQFADFGGDTAQTAGKSIVGGPEVATPNVARAPVSQVEYAPFGGDTAAPKTAGNGINWDYLGTDKAASDTAKVGLGGLGSLSLYQDNLTGTGDTGTGADLSLPETEVYYTPYGERRTRVIDRPRYGNVNMANGGDVFGDYDGVDMNRDGGAVISGNTFANGGMARYGFGGEVRNLQPGGWFGDMHGKTYGALGADKVMPGGAVGSLIPGANQFNDKKREEEERKRAEEEAGIAAALKAKETADFNQKWSDRYNAPVQMANGGFTDGGGLGYYSDGGRLLKGPGDGVSDNIPATIEDRKPARLADGEFVVPARAVSELGNGSTEAGSKQLYAMLDRIAKKRKKGKGLAYQANPKKLLPA